MNFLISGLSQKIISNRNNSNKQLSLGSGATDYKALFLEMQARFNKNINTTTIENSSTNTCQKLIISTEGRYVPPDENVFNPDGSVNQGLPNTDFKLELHCFNKDSTITIQTLNYGDHDYLIGYMAYSKLIGKINNDGDNIINIFYDGDLIINNDFFNSNKNYTQINGINENNINWFVNGNVWLNRASLQGNIISTKAVTIQNSTITGKIVKNVLE